MISADFKQKIHGKKPLKGTFVKMNCPTAVEALGLAGLDFDLIGLAIERNFIFHLT